jgi:hypothetical protein
MKKFYLLAFLSLASFCRAQNPEDDIPNFDLDDYFVEPKFSMTVGTRTLSGSKVSFAGQGLVQSSQAISGEFDTDVVRTYHDGVVVRDQREGATDGKTNTWGYTDERQVVDDGASIAFHTYKAEITDNTKRSNDPGMSLGTELVLSRDMGSIGKRLQWRLFAGVGINGIESSSRDSVLAAITTVTDKYGLDGQTLPSGVPYGAPSSGVDADGNVIETTVFLGQAPDSRTTTTDTNSTQVSNFWHLKGTYLTLRLGPTLIYSITDNLRFTVSGGPALVYSGTTYSVEQTLVPDTSDTLVTTVSETEGNNLTGYYVDATMEYLITERAGLYLGTFYQTSGSYVQTITENGSSYTTDVDLSKLSGFRAGLNFKF